MYRAFNKLFRSRIKFYARFLKLFLFKKSFRNNLFLDGRLIDVEASGKDVRLLLKLNPTWAKGHLLLGILSYESYLMTKDAYFLGVLDISSIALEKIDYDKSVLAVLRLCLDFLLKNYSKINSIPLDTDVVKEDAWAKNYIDVLRLEVIGASYLAEEKREIAKKIFSKIHPDKRSQEIKVAFMMFEAVGT